MVRYAAAAAAAALLGSISTASAKVLCDTTACERPPSTDPPVPRPPGLAHAQAMREIPVRSMTTSCAAAGTCDGVDMSGLRNAVKTIDGADGSTYKVSVCGPIPQMDLPSGCWGIASQLRGAVIITPEPLAHRNHRSASPCRVRGMTVDRPSAKASRRARLRSSMRCVSICYRRPS